MPNSPSRRLHQLQMRRGPRTHEMFPRANAHRLWSLLGYGKRDGTAKSYSERLWACPVKSIHKLLVVIALGLLVQLCVHFGGGNMFWRVKTENKVDKEWAAILNRSPHGSRSKVKIAAQDQGRLPGPTLPGRVESGSEEVGALELGVGEVDDGASEKGGGMGTGRAGRLMRKGKRQGRREGDNNLLGGKQCATVEEMGRQIAGDPAKVARASLRVRRWLESHFMVHGASAVRALPPEEFCSRKFVIEKMHRDGLGNNLYKILTAGGIALMLNRSLIIGEHFSTDEDYVISQGKDFKLPWGDYARFNPETFSMREVKQLWVRNRCQERFGRKLEMRVDQFLHPQLSHNMCEDWKAWDVPIVHYKDAEDFTALQCFLKSVAPRMRAQARRLLGTTYEPDSRPNTFGELTRFLFRPAEDVASAVKWSLRGGRDPDISVHMRMMHSTMEEACEAAAEGVRAVLKAANWQAPPGAEDKRPRIAILSDTEESIQGLTTALGPDFEVVTYDYKKWMEEHPTHPSMNNVSYTTPAERVADWGSTPRWVAVVDFFLASRATLALIAGARNRIATTFSQLAAGLAAANSINEETETMPFAFYSAFHAKLLALGLRDSKGRSHVWHTFAGKLCCHNQGTQLARTPLLPYAWFDAPMQSPMPLALQRWRNLGLRIGDRGEVSKDAIEAFCQSRKSGPPLIRTLRLPKRTWADWRSSQ